MTNISLTTFMMLAIGAWFIGFTVWKAVLTLSLTFSLEKKARAHPDLLNTATAFAQSHFPGDAIEIAYGWRKKRRKLTPFTTLHVNGKAVADETLEHLFYTCAIAPTKILARLACVEDSVIQSFSFSPKPLTAHDQLKAHRHWAEISHTLHPQGQPK